MPIERQFVRRQEILRRSVQRRSRDEESPKFAIALDFGISRDFTALVLLKRVENEEDQISDEIDKAQDRIKYHVGHLKRFPLRTQAPKIISFVLELMARRTLAGRTGLIVDATGAGMPIVQEMQRCGLKPVPITITGGNGTKGNNVPKKDLVSRLLLLFEQRRLRIPPDINLRDELVAEFENFIVRFTAKGNATYSAAAGAHDDLIMALSLACHFFERRRGTPRVHATVIGPTYGRTSARFDAQRMLEDRLLYR
jgi:hypothetical protein